MRKETAAGWLTAILTCVLLTGCGSQAAGAARTAAAIESQAGSTEEIADHFEEKAEKPRVVLQQEEMGKETERSESEAGTEPEPETDTPDPYADLLKDPEVMAANKIYAKETAEPGKTRIVFAGDILFDSHYAIMASLLKRGQGIEGGISADLLSIMRDADIFMVNNEFPYTNRGTPTAGKSLPSGRIRSMRPGCLTWAQILCRSRTTTRMITGGVPDGHARYAGVHRNAVCRSRRNLEEAVRLVSFIANGKKFTFISATQIERLNPPDTKGATETSPGVFRCLDITKLLEVIGEARADSDYVIVYIHWGPKELTSWTTGRRNRLRRSRQQTWISSSGITRMCCSRSGMWGSSGRRTASEITSLTQRVSTPASSRRCLNGGTGVPAVYPGKAGKLPCHEGGRSGEGADSCIYEEDLPGNCDR